MKKIVFALAIAASAAAQAAPLSPSDLALLNRITYGATQDDIREMERLGRDGYLRQQLRYQGDRPLPPEAKSFIANLRISRTSMESLANEARQMRMAARNKPADEKKEANKTMLKEFAELDFETFQRRTVRALYSPNQLQEMLTWFWFNHFNVFQGKGPVRFMLPDYEESAIRPHVLGRFRDLLQATLMHPAMLVYLDNAQNARGKINENYARELMELHTLGVDSGYTQADVQALARILTGAGIDPSGRKPRARDPGFHSGLFYFNPRRHDDGPKTFLGVSIGGSSEFDEITRTLDILSRHPATAHFISKKLAVYFYGDEPPAPLVERMANEFLHTDGDIAQTLYAMFTAPEFKDGTRLPPKFKDPVQYVYSSLRLVYPGQAIVNYRPITGVLGMLGEPVYGRQTPDGYGMREKDWASSDQLEKRFELARGVAMAPGRFFLPQVDERTADKMAVEDSRRKARAAHPIDRRRIAALISGTSSQKTKDALEKAGNDAEWASLVLSAPEFMYR